MTHPKIGIYVGEGASHSWIWFVDTFERLGLFDLIFVNETNINDLLEDLDVLAIGGGDTYTIAEGLGPEKLDNILHFIKGGGLYIGTCAGAYLPLCSSKEMLCWFNVVEAKINNLSKSLPEPKKMKEKYCVSYGCDLIYHPVRGPLKVKMNERSIIAPLYGGPPMMAYSDVEELAHYEGFTDKTLFLVDEKLAEKTLFGRAAVVKKDFHKGCLYLYGPHFEHPEYPEANEVLLNAIIKNANIKESRSFNHDRAPISINQVWLKDFKREISNSRIVANGIMMSPITWKIGQKVWEPEKFSYFLDGMWKRLSYFDGKDFLGEGDSSEIIELSKETTSLLRGLKKGLKQGIDTTKIAEEAFCNLRMLTSKFFEVYLWCKMRDF